MKSIALILSFLVASTIVVVESQIIIAGAIAAAIALKIAAGAGLIAGGIIGSRFNGGDDGYDSGYGGGYGNRGGRGRFGRAAVDVDNIVLDASHNDALDCAKKLVCHVNAKDPKTHGEEEKAIFELFGQAENVDVAKESVEFDLAALMGRKVGAAQCNKIYARCPTQEKQLLEVVRDAYHNNLF